MDTYSVHPKSILIFTHSCNTLLSHNVYLTVYLDVSRPFFTTFFRSHFYVSSNSSPIRAPTLAGHAADCKSTQLNACEVTTASNSRCLRTCGLCKWWSNTSLVFLSVSRCSGLVTFIPLWESEMFINHALKGGINLRSPTHYRFSTIFKHEKNIAAYISQASVDRNRYRARLSVFPRPESATGDS